MSSARRSPASSHSTGRIGTKSRRPRPRTDRLASACGADGCCQAAERCNEIAPSHLSPLTDHAGTPASSHEPYVSLHPYLIARRYGAGCEALHISPADPKRIRAARAIRDEKPQAEASDERLRLRDVQPSYTMGTRRPL